MKNALHFVGFRNDAYNRAVRLFGKPDFIHRHWDKRAVDEVFEGDTVVFAVGDENQPVALHSDDDSVCF